MADRGTRTKFRRALFALSPVLLLGSCSSVTTAGCAVPPELLAEGLNSAAAPVLAQLIRHSRGAALDEGARPIPAHIQDVLEPHFGAAMLQRVRWTSASDRWTLDTFVAAASPRHKAVTFDDVVVFLDPAATRELDVWIHELLHVRQAHRAGGLDQFSRHYVAGWRRIEADTVQATKAILKALGRRPSRSAAQDEACGCLCSSGSKGR